MLRVVENEEGTQEVNAPPSTLDELAREGARRMLMTALDLEVEAYIDAHRHERDETGRAAVVRNGPAQSRKVTMGSGTVDVRAPRVNDKRTDEKFTSAILPPYMRRSPKVDEVLPGLYLRGLSTGDFKPALKSLLGDDAAGLSPTSISRFTARWEKEYTAFQRKTLADRSYVYVWVDGVHFNVRLEDDRLCTLVIIGVRADGTKDLIVVEDGYRESTDSWSSVLRGLKRRGMRAPMVAIGDGALGFWAAVKSVWPQTRGQRDWCHKLGNVLDKLPRRLQPKAKRMLREAMYADTKKDAQRAITDFCSEYETKHPKAVACLKKDEDMLLTFFDFPAEHWIHLRTSNIIESAFATVRLRQRVTKGAGTRTKALLMAFKLLDMAALRWRKLNGSQLLPLVVDGVKFADGEQVKQTETDQERKVAA
jgi:transposase-like protein